MAEIKDLKKRHQNPDPEMLRHMQMLNKIEVLNMMREMGIVQTVNEEKPAASQAEGEKKR